MTQQLDLFGHQADHEADLAAKQALAKGERRKSDGMAVAAANAPDLLTQWRIAFLAALLKSPDGTATTDDSVADLDEQFAIGAKARGSIPRGLAQRGIIRRRSYRKSKRPSRHATPIAVWGLVDREAAAAELARLRREVAAQKNINPLKEDQTMTNDQLTPPYDLKKDIRQLHEIAATLAECAAHYRERKYSYDEIIELTDEIQSACDCLSDSPFPHPRHECSGATPRTLREWIEMPQDSICGSHHNKELTAAEMDLINN